ncbi:MAG: FAD:protein transferase [Candidatus Saccharibacteria bacterium]|nr:FAD:protein transferase [Candidatus Saccharibacteria bacterium]MDB5180790.1 FAD:protein transferase [Candidatus Saccharibacteria bacterium]
MLKHNYSFEAIGTPWSIETAQPIPVHVKKVIQQRIQSFDAVYSRFREDSLITQISKQAGRYTFPNDATKLFDFYKQLYGITNGKVTPLIGDMLSRAGYDARYSLKPQPLATLPDWGQVMSWDGSILSTSQPIKLDVGAAGKGYLVDIIAEILDGYSISEYVVDASGDLRHKGTTENIVGLEHPANPGKIIGAVDVQNRSLCASASNRRIWGKGMHHIFDPDEKAPAKDVIASWVIADETMVADGLATALFFVEPKILQHHYTFEYVRMYASGGVGYSAYFEDKIF